VKAAVGIVHLDLIKIKRGIKFDVSILERKKKSNETIYSIFFSH